MAWGDADECVEVQRENIVEPSSGSGKTIGKVGQVNEVLQVWVVVLGRKAKSFKFALHVGPDDVHGDTCRSSPPCTPVRQRLPERQVHRSLT
jgi:hypothetical protein